MTVSVRDDELAPAKVNLYLHVTGRREDGYHELDSLVAFADIGDRLHAEPAGALSLRVEGPKAGALAQERDNLVLTAAERLRREFDVTAGAALVLHKTLPVAAGLGGGSADAAAALRLLGRLWSLMPCPDRLHRLGLELGADVPVCLRGEPMRMQGIGDVLQPLASFPALPVVLANPGVPLATPAVFRHTSARSPAARWPGPGFSDPGALIVFLAGCRNDLQDAAMQLAPEVAGVVAALAREDGCLLARMSGSGASCFGLFADDAAARQAEAGLRAAHPAWWVAAGRGAWPDERPPASDATAGAVVGWLCGFGSQSFREPESQRVV